MATRFRLLLFLLLSAPVVLAQDARSEFGVVRARLIEAAMGQMFPGNTVEWTPTLALVQGSTRRPIRVVGVDYRPDDDGGYTAVTSVEFPENRPAIGAAIDAFETPLTRSPAEIAVFKTTAQFAVTELRRGNLNDPASWIEEVDAVELSTLTYDQVWPDAYVTYTAMYATPDFHGEIRWDEKLLTSPGISATGRIPGLLWRLDKKSGTLHTDESEVNVVDDHTLSFASQDSKQVISNCADPCLPDGRVLLALWWTTATATR